jgi:cell division protein FtsB
MRLRLIMVALALVAAGLGYRLLFGEASLADLADRERRIAAAQAELEGARARNAALAAEVADLRTGLETVEERARADLGMIRPGETYYRIIGDASAP